MSLMVGCKAIDRKEDYYANNDMSGGHVCPVNLPAAARAPSVVKPSGDPDDPGKSPWRHCSCRMPASWKACSPVR